MKLGHQMRWPELVGLFDNDVLHAAKLANSLSRRGAAGLIQFVPLQLLSTVKSLPNRIITAMLAGLNLTVGGWLTDGLYRSDRRIRPFDGLARRGDENSIPRCAKSAHVNC